MLVFFFFKQKTAYEMRISDWSSDVCSSDLLHLDVESRGMVAMGWTAPVGHDRLHELETVMRSEGDDDFFAWPVTSEKQIYPVLYLEPQSPSNHRSEERRVGKESVSTCRSRGWTYH